MILETDGKQIELFHEGFSVRARFVGGGELPDALKGSWTNKDFAKNAVLKYLSNKPKKEKVDLKLNKADYKR